MAEQLHFSRSLYDVSAVEATVAVYDALAKFDVKILESDIQVTISEPDPDVEDVLLDEFSNHVLSETIKRSRK